MSIESTIKLVVLLGGPHIHVTFGAVDKFIVKIFLGTSYIDRSIARIFPLERRIVPFHFRPVAILGSYSFEEATNAMVNDHSDCNDVQKTNEHDDKHTGNLSIPVRMSRQCVIPPFSGSPLLVTKSAAGIVTLKPHSNITKSKLGSPPKV